MSLSELAVKYALKLGASEAHSVESEGEMIRVEVERDTISNVSYGRSSSLGLAVIVDNRIGFASLKNPTEDSIKLLAERGYRLAKSLIGRGFQNLSRILSSRGCMTGGSQSWVSTRRWSL